MRKKKAPVRTKLPKFRCQYKKKPTTTASKIPRTLNLFFHSLLRILSLLGSQYGSSISRFKCIFRLPSVESNSVGVWVGKKRTQTEERGKNTKCRRVRLKNQCREWTSIFKKEDWRMVGLFSSWTNSQLVRRIFSVCIDVQLVSAGSLEKRRRRKSKPHLHLPGEAGPSPPSRGTTTGDGMSYFIFGIVE